MRMLSTHRFFFISILIYGILCCPALGQATITETQAISFGTFALSNNNAVYTSTVQTNGTTSSDPEYLIFSDAVEGRWDLTNFPASTLLTINITSGDLTLNGAGSGEPFSVGSFDIFPSNTTTNASGALSIKIGAVLSTSGTGTMYADGSFSANGLLTVNF